MATVFLFHHIQGLTPGVRDLAGRLSEGGHDVRTPDLYAGRIFADIESGFAFSRMLDRETLNAEVERGIEESDGPVVFAGISWGVMFAQRLAQTHPRPAGALLLEACIPPGDGGFGPWPARLPAQIHGMDDDEFFAHEGDMDAARALIESAPEAGIELFTYPGSAHLFTDSSLPSYDSGATDLVIGRARAFLDSLPS